MALVRLKRKAGEAAEAAMAGLDRLLSVAFARAAQAELGVALRLTGVDRQRVGLSEVVEGLPDRALVAVLDEGGGEGTGAVILDAPLMAGMVEALTTGIVTPGDGAERRPTRTDAALVAPVLDRALAGIEEGAEEAGFPELDRSFRFATVTEGARGLSLLLDEGIYHRIRVQVDLADGARRGCLWLVMPEGRPAAMPQVEDGEQVRFRAELARQVAQAEARLEGVLLRFSLPLGQVMSLCEEQMLPLPGAAIGRVALESLDGKRIAEGRLGRHGSLRAIRLNGEAEGVVGSGLAPGLPPVGGLG